MYSAFTDFHFLILILSQACNEITWLCSKHDFCMIIEIDLPLLTGAAWHFYQWLIGSCLFQANQVNSSELSCLESFSLSQLSNLKSKLLTTALLVQQFFSLWSEGSWNLSSYLILSLMNYRYLDSWGLSPILKIWHGVKLSSQYHSHVLNNFLALCLFLQQF